MRLNSVPPVPVQLVLGHLPELGQLDPAGLGGREDVVVAGVLGVGVGTHRQTLSIPSGVINVLCSFKFGLRTPILAH